MSTSNNVSDLKELVRKAISKVIECYKKEFGEPEKDRALWPSASASIVFVKDDFLEYIVLGDSPIVFYPKDKPPTVVRDPKLIQLDEEVIKIIHQYVFSGMELSQARKRVLPKLKEHRKMICTSTGYSVVSLDTACVEKALYGRIETKDLDYVIMSTDGFMRIVDVFGYIKDYKTLLHEVLSKNLANLMVKLRELEYSDKECKKYPRLSVSDDATSLLLKIC